jgi:hypothetical protein
MYRRPRIFTVLSRDEYCATIPLLVAAAALLCVPQVAATPEETDDAATTNPNGDDTSKTRIIIISILSEGAEMDQIERSIVAQLADLSVDITFHHVTALPSETENRDDLARALMEAHRATAAFIIDAKNFRPLRVLLETGDRIETTSRMLDVTPGVPLHEALAVIVRSATTTVLEQKKRRATAASAGNAGPKKAAAPKSPSLPKRSDSKSPISDGEGEVQKLYIEADFALGYYSQGVPPWLGMAAYLGWQPIRYLQLYAGYVFFSKVSKRSTDVTLTLRRHPVHIGAGYFRPLKRVVLGGGASVSIDYVTESISSQNEALDLSPEGGEVNTALLCYAHIGIRILSPLSLHLNLGAEIPLNSTEYGIDEGETNRILLELLPVQPVAMLGLRGHFF